MSDQPKPRANPDFYRVGGTLRISDPSYVKRVADQQLLESLRNGEYCYVLTARQIGKSSLMVRTAARLRDLGISNATVDLTRIATEKIPPEPWYLGQIRRIVKQLCPDFDYMNWWKENASLSEVHRYVIFLSEVLLERISTPVVLFIDEIDSTLRLPYRDDFFAAIRSLYNQRASDSELERLTFVLLGVASPSDLISAVNRTPFNVGKRIELDDFTLEEARDLTLGLAPEPSLACEMLVQIFSWTGGHPYLTQRACSVVAQWAKESWDTSRAIDIVEDLVRETFLTERGQNTDTNLRDVRKRLLEDPRSEELLNLYRLIRQGELLSDDERNPNYAVLKLNGIVKANEDRVLQVRNRIYYLVFDLSWIAKFSTADTSLTYPPVKEFTYDVFILYGHTDRAWVRSELLPRLEASGLRICIDFKDFKPGVPRVPEMERAVLSSRKTVLVLTPDYLKSAWTEVELVTLQMLDATNRERRLIPLLKAKCDLPPLIRRLTYVNFAEPEDWDIAWAQLLTALGAPPVQEAPEEPAWEEWCLAHPYPMPPNFTGRAAEREMLSQWLEADPDHPLLMLRALGGFGKSALGWHWLLHDVDPARWPRVVWWSFYEGDASFDNFLRETLTYLGVDPSGLGPRQQADALLRLLHQSGVLLILDGFERALRAYSSMNAAYQGDSPLPPPPPLPLPSSGKGEGTTPELAEGEARVGEGYRDCVNPIAEHFLRSMASLPGIRGKVLMTTRLRPRALETHGGDLLQGCREEELTQMQPADAVAFFRAQGVRGSRVEIELACEPYGYHPLSLRLLASLVANDLQQPGDIVAARRLDVSSDLVARRQHVLAQAYENLTPARQQLLSRIACFRGAVAYDALRALASQTPEVSLDTDLRALVARGLLQHDRRTARYDLHPIVRRYAYSRLGDAERRAAHGHLRDNFAAVPSPEGVERLEDLAPLIELYHHTVQTGRYDEAIMLFRDRLVPPLYFQFGAHQLQIELLRALFPEGKGQLPRLKKKSDQALMLNALASSYSLSGQPRNAVRAFELAVELFEKLGDKRSLAVGLGNLADDQLKIGALQAAEANLRRRIALCREIEDEFNEAIGHQELGRLLAYRGAWGEAEEELAVALTLFEKERHVQGQGVTWAYQALRALLLARWTAITPNPQSPISNTPNALAAARRALELADEFARIEAPMERDYMRAHWLLGAAHRANGDMEDADRHLSEALTRCRRINLVEFEADILLDLARLRVATTLPPASGREAPQTQGGRDEALRLAQEALVITERCGYVLQGADVHLFLAQMALDDGDEETALEHAREARRLATCDGPPDYTYKVAYDEAEALLQRIERG